MIGFNPLIGIHVLHAQRLPPRRTSTAAFQSPDRDSRASRFIVLYAEFGLYLVSIP